MVAAETDGAFVHCRDVMQIYHRGRDRGLLDRIRGRDRRTDTRVYALRDVSLSIAHDETVLVVGPSGSGKSTLLHLLAGLEQPTAGTIRVGGELISELSERQRTRYRRDHVGIIFQDFRLLDALSARANVGLPLVELGISKRERRERATDLLTRVGLGDRLHHKPGELSGGERQRVAIARALITDPDLLVADEPTGELDSETGQTVLDVLAREGEDRVVVVASHDPATGSIADRTITLRDGIVQEDQ